MENRLEEKIDSTDLRIIGRLMEDGRVPFSTLAEEIGASNTLVHQRVRKLKEAGILDRPVYRISSEKAGYDTCAFVLIIAREAKDIKFIIEELRKVPEIVSCMSIMGRYDLMVQIYAVNNRHLQDLMHDRIQSIPGVEGTNTTVAFEMSFERQVTIPDPETLELYRR